MADKPQKKAPPKNTPKPAASKDDSELDTFFDDFFENNQPHQFDETENADQQRQWISDQLMWETTLGMREDEAINNVITPRDEAKAATSQSQPQSKSSPQKRGLSEQDRQLLRTQVSQPPAKAKPPTTSQKTRPVQKSPTSQTRQAQTRQQKRAQNPVRSQPGKVQQSQSPHNRKSSVSASKAPVRQVQPSPAAKPAAQKPVVKKGLNVRPQSRSITKTKPERNPANTVPKTASSQGKATGVKSHPSPNARPPAPMRTPPTKAKPVKREAELPEEEQIILDMDGELGRAKYLILGKQLAVALALLLVTFIGGFYLGGSNSNDDAVAQQDSATTTAKSDQTTIAPPEKQAAKKVTPQKAKPKPVNKTAFDRATENTMKSNTATVFEGKDIDIEQFESPSASLESESDPIAGRTDSPSAPQGDKSLTAEFTAAEPTSSPNSDTTSDSITAADTQVAILEKSQTQTETANGENYLQALLDKSLQSFENKQWKTLIELSNEILAIDPSTVTALTNRAAANTELGDFAAALADCNRAIKIESENPLAINNRGYVYEKMGDFQNAILDYQKACTLGVKLSCSEAKRLKKETKS
jgi:hypothetical protein